MSSPFRFNERELHCRELYRVVDPQPTTPVSITLTVTFFETTLPHLHLGLFLTDKSSLVPGFVSLTLFLVLGLRLSPSFSRLPLRLLLFCLRCILDSLVYLQILVLIRCRSLQSGVKVPSSSTLEIRQEIYTCPLV